MYYRIDVMHLGAGVWPMWVGCRFGMLVSVVARLVVISCALDLTSTR